MVGPGGWAAGLANLVSDLSQLPKFAMLRITVRERAWPWPFFSNSPALSLTPTEEPARAEGGHETASSSRSKRSSRSSRLREFGLEEETFHVSGIIKTSS